VVDLRASITLERALRALVVATIVASVLAAGSLVGLLDEARAARWVFLVLLAGAAVAYAFRRRRELRPGGAHMLAASFLALAFVSTSWSAFPGLTFARAVSLAVLFAACVGAAFGAAGRLPSLRGLLDAIVTAAAGVGLGGLLVLAFANDRAVQPATAQEPARFQGLGGGPNTAAMLLALALPLAVHAAVDARSGGRRLIALVVAVLLLASIVASGSRGPFVAAFAGLGVYAALATPSAGPRSLALLGVGALLLASVAGSRLPSPDPTVPARPGTTLPLTGVAAPGYVDANLRCRLQEDVGRLPCGQVSRQETSRSLLGGSGRRQAWEGALRLGAERPLAGFGFGTENKVFVDRYFAHGSNLPENSYVGMFLQLGVAGAGLLLVLLGSLAASARRALHRAREPGGRIVAAFAGGLAAGLVLALTQSYLYAAGGNATLAVWLCAFLLPAAAISRDARPG
jgi:hypothetical protein